MLDFKIWVRNKEDGRLYEIGQDDINCMSDGDMPKDGNWDNDTIRPFDPENCEIVEIKIK
jgi:hypothetical protein